MLPSHTEVVYGIFYFNTVKYCFFNPKGPALRAVPPTNLFYHSKKSKKYIIPPLFIIGFLLEMLPKKLNFFFLKHTERGQLEEKSFKIKNMLFFDIKG